MSYDNTDGHHYRVDYIGTNGSYRTNAVLEPWLEDTDNCHLTTVYGGGGFYKVAARLLIKSIRSGEGCFASEVGDRFKIYRVFPNGVIIDTGAYILYNSDGYQHNQTPVYAKASNINYGADMIVIISIGN
jgi:hypothetical protein